MKISIRSSDVPANGLRVRRASARQRIEAWQVPRRLGRFRYRLGFLVNPAGRGRLLFVGLNPSTASLAETDPTVDVFCRGLAVRNGFRKLEIVNLFGYRSTDKSALPAVPDPVGRMNDRHLAAAVRAADAVLVGWGKYFHPLVRSRADCILALLATAARGPLLAVGVNGDGSPRHPLYQRVDRALRPFAGRSPDHLRPIVRRGRRAV